MENRNSLKIIILGDIGVGKTSTIKSFTTGNFGERSESTIGVVYMNKQMVINGVNITIGLWDTGGQERFNALPPNFFRDIHGVVLMYDVSQRSTLTKLNVFIDELKRNVCMDEVICLLIGNKIDKTREVAEKEAKVFAHNHGMMYTELSAKTKEGMLSAFQELVKKILDSGLYDPRYKSSVDLRRAYDKAEGNPSCCYNINFNFNLGFSGK